MKLRDYTQNLCQSGRSVFTDIYEHKLPSAAAIRHDWRNITMPYGQWTCEDDRVVLFNRDYLPIWEKKNGLVQPANCYEWVPWVKQEWFYNDSHSVTQSIKIGLKVLRDWGVRHA